MSSSYPPGGTQGPEYLEQGGGSPLAHEPKQRTRGRKPAVLAGGAIAGLLLVGGGVWAATWYFGHGPQPAEALPASTLGYVSVDLDPSGQQKIEALKMLNKFPAIKDELKLNADDDIRQRLFEEVEKECPDIDYGDDIAPWLGDRAAVAAVDTGAKDPSPVFVVQVKDADAADAGLTKLRSCSEDSGNSDSSSSGADSTNDQGGWAIDGDWAVVAESDAVAKKVVDATADGSLADDSDYQHWTDEAGDPGVVSMYFAPAAGDYLADNLDQLDSIFAGSGSASACAGSTSSYSTDPGTDPFSDDPVGCDDTSSSATNHLVPPQLSDALHNFKGGAATVRFSGGALELEVAADPGVTGAQKSMAGSDRGAEVVASLPEDTAAAVGVAFDDGWFSDLVDQMASYAGQSGSELMSQLSQESGLDLPADAETLAGDSFALSLGSDFNLEGLMNSSDGSGVPVAAKVEGDPDAIEKVLDKLRPQAGTDANALGSDASGDMVAIGPDADYRSHVLERGSLGDTAVFRDLLPDADQASAVFFVNFDAGDWLTGLAGGSKEAEDNLEPLEGLGMASWADDDSSHLVVRLATN